MVQRFFVGYSTLETESPAEVRHFDIDIVKRDLKNHFLTRKGERPMQPNFGSITWDLLYEPYDRTIKDRIIADSKAIIAQDPRVTFVDMTVKEFEHGLILAFLLNFAPENLQDSLYVSFTRSNSTGDNVTATDPVQLIDRGDQRNKFT